MANETGRLSGILRDLATMKRHKNPDGYNGLAANLEAAADLLDTQCAEGARQKRAKENWMDQYEIQQEIIDRVALLRLDLEDALRISKVEMRRYRKMYRDLVSGTRKP